MSERSIHPSPETVVKRARETRGSSNDAIYSMVANELRSRGIQSGILYDVGCGAGKLAEHVEPYISSYVGVDVVDYGTIAPPARFIKADLDQVPWPLAEAAATVVTSVETIEHLENPRLHLRQLTRIVEPGGLVLVTTPNNLSWLSLFTLAYKGMFNAFQERPGSYPAHITALVEIDLVRIARECGLVEIRTRFTDAGRIPGTARHWPSMLRGRRFSDNLLVSGIRPT